MELYQIMNKFSNKSIDDINLNDLSTLQYILENLPNDVEYIIKGDSKLSISDYVYNRSDEFLNASDEEYDKIEGKCFYCKETGIIFKVLYVLKGDEVDNYHFHKYEFVYEEFQQYKDGSWHGKDYIYLQEDAKGEHPENMNEYYDPYKKYAKISPNAEMNLGGENMYQLGKDGNIYVDYSCGGDYYIYEECKESKFIAAKEEAIDNDGDYVVE